jgi:hypothetical protein
METLKIDVGSITFFTLGVIMFILAFYLYGLYFKKEAEGQAVLSMMILSLLLFAISIGIATPSSSMARILCIIIMIVIYIIFLVVKNQNPIEYG